MDPLADPTTALAFGTWVLLMLLDVNQSLHIPNLVDVEENSFDPLSAIVHTLDNSSSDVSQMFRATLHQFRLCTPFEYLEDRLGFWVKPRSTTWFSRFLLEQYDNTRWVSIFRMTKPVVFALADLLRPHVQRANTKYRVAIPILI